MATRAFQVRPRTSQSHSNAQQDETEHDPWGPFGPGPGQRLDGQTSRIEARQLQDVQYLEDKKKFDEKERKKAEKKRIEKWERYSHVELGRKLAESDVPQNNLELTRQQQQSLYETTTVEGLRLEQERKAARVKRDEQKREEKLKKYAQVSTGRRLNGDGQCSNFTGSRKSPLRLAMEDVNSRASSVRSVEEKNKICQTKKVTSETTRNDVRLAGSSSRLNDLNSPEVPKETTRNDGKSKEKEEEYRRQMRQARERMQKLYNEKK